MPHSYQEWLVSCCWLHPPLADPLSWVRSQTCCQLLDQAQPRYSPPWPPHHLTVSHCWKSAPCLRFAVIAPGCMACILVSVKSAGANVILQISRCQQTEFAGQSVSKCNLFFSPYSTRQNWSWIDTLSESIIPLTYSFSSELSNRSNRHPTKSRLEWDLLQSPQQKIRFVVKGCLVLNKSDCWERRWTPWVSYLKVAEHSTNVSNRLRMSLQEIGSVMSISFCKSRYSHQTWAIEWLHQGSLPDHMLRHHDCERLAWLKPK